MTKPEIRMSQIARRVADLPRRDAGYPQARSPNSRRAYSPTSGQLDIRAPCVPPRPVFDARASCVPFRHATDERVLLN